MACRFFFAPLSRHDWVAFCIALLYVCVVCVCVVCIVLCVCMYVSMNSCVRVCSYALCACISSVYMHTCLLQLGDTSTQTIGHTGMQHISNKYCSGDSITALHRLTDNIYSCKTYWHCCVYCENLTNLINNMQFAKIFSTNTCIQYNY